MFAAGRSSGCARVGDEDAFLSVCWERGGYDFPAELGLDPNLTVLAVPRSTSPSFCAVPSAVWLGGYVLRWTVEELCEGRQRGLLWTGA